MLDMSHIPTGNNADVQTFMGMGTAAGEMWQTWLKPRGKTMCHILLVGKGGNGGTGVIGAAGGGGGGGGSGGQVSLTLPLWAIPDRLYLTLAGQATGSTLASYISIAPKLTAGAGVPVVNDTLAYANGGANGGNAATTTAGALGAAGIISAVGTMPLGWQWADTVLAGHAGTAGGAGTTTGTTGGTISYPTGGQIVMGGSGGGACPTTVGGGTTGGGLGGAGIFPSSPDASGGTGTTPPMRGANGFRPIPNLLYGMGGQGGGGVGSNATGAGLVQASGGHGAPGCGGGGMGGAFTGSTAGFVGMGGPAFCIITCW